MPIIDDEIIGQLNALEFIVTQCLAISLVSVPVIDKDAFIEDSRKMFFVRANRFPASTVPSALLVLDRILAAALLSAKGHTDEE